MNIPKVTVENLGYGSNSWSHICVVPGLDHNSRYQLASTFSLDAETDFGHPTNGTGECTLIHINGGNNAELAKVIAVYLLKGLRITEASTLFPSQS